MKKYTKIFTGTIALFLLSAPALVALGAAPKTFKELIEVTFIGGIIRPIVPFLVGLAVVMFLYGVVLVMFSEGGEKQEEGKSYMFWGIVGIFVMVSVWGLVAILTNTFGLDNTAKPIRIEKINI